MSGLFSFLRPRLHGPVPPPAASGIAPEPVVRPAEPQAPAARLSYHHVFTGRRNWLAAGPRQVNGVAMLVMEESLDPGRAVIAIVPEHHRQLCLIVAPDGSRIGVRSDGMHGIAVSAMPLQYPRSSLVRLQHPCLASRYMAVTMPHQGGLHGQVMFDDGGHTDLAVFDFVRMSEAAVPAAVRAIGGEFARVASQPYTARGLMAALAGGAVRPELAEALLRVLRPEEGEVLARDLLEQPDTRALLRDVLPGNVWAQQVWPALAAWNGTREPVPGGALVSPGSDEFAGRPMEGHGMPQAGHVLTALARSQIRPRRNACIITTIRNEGPYILDWVSYHLSIGFEHIFIYTNDNSDGSDELLRALARHGVVTLIENAAAPILSPQHKAYSHGLMLLPQILDYRWCALIDGDEYIAFDTGMFRSIVDFITWHEAQPVDAIALCWLVHIADPGDGWRDASSLHRFPMRGRDVNAHVKSMFRTRMFWYSHPHFPHSLSGRFVFRTEDGRIHHTHKVTERLEAFAESPSAERAWINHYVMRTAGEALLKFSRGRADQMGGDAVWRQANLNHTAGLFVYLWHSDRIVRDERILACAAGQPEVLARLMALPGVAEPAARIAAAMPGRLIEAARSFVSSVSLEGQNDAVRQFHHLIAQVAEGEAVVS